MLSNKIPTIRYRQGNNNLLSFIISQAGELQLPDNDLSIKAEIRASDVGRIIATVDLATADPDEGSVSGLLPVLAPNIYYVGLLFDRTDEPDFRVGVCRLEIVPTGRVESLVDATGLNVEISETKQVIRILVDDNPSASIAAYWAGQVRTDKDAAETAKDAAFESQVAAASSASTASQKALEAGISEENAASRAQAAAASEELAGQHADGIGNALADVTAVQMDIIQTKELIDASQQDVSTKAGQVATAKQAVDTAKQAVDTAKGQVDAAKQAVDTTKGQIDAIKTAIDGIQTDVAAKQQIASNKADEAAASALALVNGFKGDWQSGVTYQVGNRVYVGGNSYERVNTSGSSDPTIDLVNWKKYAQGGGSVNDIYVVYNSDITSRRTQLTPTNALISSTGQQLSPDGAGSMASHSFQVTEGKAYSIQCRVFLNTGFSSRAYAWYSSETVQNSATYLGGSPSYSGALVQVLNHNVSAPAGAKSLVVLNATLSNLIVTTELNSKTEIARVDASTAGKAVSSGFATSNVITANYTQIFATGAQLAENGAITSVTAAGSMSALKYSINAANTYDLQFRTFLNSGYSSLMYAWYSSDTLQDVSTFLGGSALMSGAYVSVRTATSLTPPPGAKSLVVLNSTLSNLIVTEKSVDILALKSEIARVEGLTTGKASTSDLQIVTAITNNYTQLFSTGGLMSLTGVLSSIIAAGSMAVYRYVINAANQYDLQFRTYLNTSYNSLAYGWYSSETVQDASTFLGGSPLFTGAFLSVQTASNLTPPAGAKVLIVLNSVLSNLIVTERSVVKTEVPLLKTAVNAVPAKIQSAVKQALSLPASKNIIYVRADGTGNFTGIQEAINSITDASVTNQYEIRICDDFLITDVTNLWLVYSPTVKNTLANPNAFVAAIITKDWVHLTGYGRRVKVSVQSPYSMAGSSHQNVQTLWLQGNVVVDNIEFEAKNARYAIHQDLSGDAVSLDINARTTLRNVKAVHLGNTDSQDGGVSWPYTWSQANGFANGLELIYENCEWETFYMHANKDFTTRNRVSFRNCRVTYKYNTPSVTGFYVGSNGSGNNFEVEVVGCNFPAIRSRIGIYDNQLLATPARDVRTMLPYFTGHSNRRLSFDSIIFAGNVLAFRSVVNNVSVQVTGGTALKALFGSALQYYEGTTDHYGFTAGTEYIVLRNTTYSFTLAHRLGNCASAPKTLLVTVGATQYTVNLDKNFVTSDGSAYTINTAPAYDNAAVVAYINTQLGGVAQATITDTNHAIGAPFEDCYEQGWNYQTTTIKPGMALVRDYTGAGGWKACGVGEYPQGVACERINPGKGGKIALFEKNLYENLLGTVTGSFPRMAKIGSTGTWTTAANLGEAVLVEMYTNIFGPK